MKKSSLAVWLSILLVWSLIATNRLQARVKPSSGFDMFSAQEEIQAGQQAAG